MESSMFPGDFYFLPEGGHAWFIGQCILEMVFRESFKIVLTIWNQGLRSENHGKSLFSVWRKWVKLNQWRRNRNVKGGQSRHREGLEHEKDQGALGECSPAWSKGRQRFPGIPWKFQGPCSQLGEGLTGNVYMCLRVGTVLLKLSFHPFIDLTKIEEEISYLVIKCCHIPGVKDRQIWCSWNCPLENNVERIMQYFCLSLLNTHTHAHTHTNFQAEYMKFEVFVTPFVTHGEITSLSFHF